MTQIKVPKCLSKISPKWVEILEAWDLDEVETYAFDRDNPTDKEFRDHENFDDKLDINNYSCCIVGEAYGFTPHNHAEAGKVYHCIRCYEFSMSFHGMICEIDVIPLQDEIKLFCEHIKVEHPELIKSDEVCESNKEKEVDI